MVGLQAMTEFVHQAVPGGYELQLDVRAQHSDAHFDVTTTNALVLQSKDVSCCGCCCFGGMRVCGGGCAYV